MYTKLMIVTAEHGGCNYFAVQVYTLFYMVTIQSVAIGEGTAMYHIIPLLFHTFGPWLRDMELRQSV